jgi:hypothetical protein
MFNPLYLTASRHGLYYFRFPIPAQCHPEAQRSCIRLSLGTRCPKEALHLARGLCYAGEHLIRQAKASRMNYSQIRDFLTFLFKEKLAKARQHIEQNGRLSEEQKRAFLNIQAFADDAIKTQHYLFSGSDQEITGLIESHELPIKSGTKQYEMLRAEYLLYQREYAKEALEIDDSYSGYSLSDTQVRETKPYKPAKKRTKLGEAIRHYQCEWCAMLQLHR